MQNTPTTQISAIENFDTTWRRKRTSSDTKKRNIFSVVCFSFFFQCSSHSLAGPVLCVCTLMWKYQYQYKRLLCALALYSLSSYVSLPSILVCVCVQWKRLRVVNETQNIRLYVNAYVCVSVCIYMYIYICTCALGARPPFQCVCLWYRCMRACFCVRVCCDVLAKNQPTYWSNRAAAFGSYAKKLWKLQLLLWMSGLILCSGTVCLLATRLRTFICIMGPPVECGSKIKTQKLSFFMKYAHAQGRITAKANRY